MIDPREHESLSALLTASQRMSIPVMLVGAFARKLGFDDARGLAPPRTRDWDFAAHVPSLTAYEDLLRCLEQEFDFDVSIERGTARHANGVEIDLLPVGALAGPDHVVRRLGSAMTVRGYAEAWQLAPWLEVGPGLSFQVPTPAGYVVLKLFAWFDRRLLKHLQDVDHVLQHFDITQGERLFDTDSNTDWERVTMDVAGAWLLGRDVAAGFDSGTREHLSAIVTAIDDVAVAGVARRIASPPSDQDEALVRARLEAFGAAMLPKAFAATCSE